MAQIRTNYTTVRWESFRFDVARKNKITRFGQNGIKSTMDRVSMKLFHNFIINYAENTGAKICLLKWMSTNFYFDDRILSLFVRIVSYFVSFRHIGRGSLADHVPLMFTFLYLLSSLCFHWLFIQFDQWIVSLLTALIANTVHVVVAISRVPRSMPTMTRRSSQTTGRESACYRTASRKTTHSKSADSDWASSPSSIWQVWWRSLGVFLPISHMFMCVGYFLSIHLSSVLLLQYA